MASFGKWQIPQTRSGRRSISVGKLLERERAGTLFKKQAEDKIPGGLADKKTPGEFPRLALNKGLKVEREHTSSNAIAREIAMDHLTEDEDYYDKLEKVEKHAFKLDGETTFQGLGIAVENGVGSTRRGENADGTKWSIKYKSPYGYIKGTTGADGEEVDCYVGPKRDADTAFVVHQKKDDGSYDEDTVMLGYRSQGAAKADILRHYSDPKYVGKVVPVAMDKLKELIESDKKLVKISTLGVSGTHEFIDVDPSDVTTLPARAPKRRGEVPTREDVDPYPNPTSEPRQESRNTATIGAFASPGGMDDMGKFGKAPETIGNKTRTWEVPSSDDLGKDDPGFSIGTSTEANVSPPFNIISQIGIGTDDYKTAMVHASFIDELGQLNAVTEGQLKAAAEVTRQDAQGALARLEKLEADRPTLGQLIRGGTVGSVIGPVASNMNKLISSGHLHTPREIAGQVASGAVFGGALPYAKHEIESGAERRKLKQYIATGQGGRLATQIENKLGTP